MFWSKIWLFLMTVGAAVALVIALVMPRPAERAARDHETARLATACNVTNIILRDNARTRVMKAAEIASPDTGLGSILAASVGTVDGDVHSRAKQFLVNLKYSDGKAPDFIILLNRSGRIVAQRGATGDSHGDSLRGYYLVDDALDGYQRDDVWFLRGSLYAVAASPVVGSSPLRFTGAVVTGRAVQGDYLDKLRKNFETKKTDAGPGTAGDGISFYAGGSMIASSGNAQIHKDVIEKVAADKPRPGVCSAPISIESGGDVYDVVASGLPGEAGALGGFFTVFSPREGSQGFSGTFGAVTKGDLGFSQFPWISVLLLFLIAVAMGMAVIWWEGDRPTRHLANDAVELAKGEQPRLDEAQHRGQQGSIARSVNVALDKLQRDAKAAKSDLDQLLGPLPGQAAASSKARVRVSSAPEMFTPPPSEFRFSDHGADAAAQASPAARRRATSAPVSLPHDPAPPMALQPQTNGSPGFGDLDLELPAPPPNVVAAVAPPPQEALQPPTEAHVVPDLVPLPMSTPLEGAGGEATPDIPSLPLGGLELGGDAGPNIGDDILGNSGQPKQFAADSQPTVISDQSQSLASEDSETTYFREVFDEFLSLKRKCGEKTDSLTFERFSKKLRKNRDALISKHNCKSVRFQVYVKDGRAALKASPVR